MKIISKYKDYYDFLTGKYGIDPKIVLDRSKKISDTNVEFLLNFDFRRIDTLYSRKNPEHNYRILVICGKYYPLISKIDSIKTKEFRLITEVDLNKKNILSDLENILPLDISRFIKKDRLKKIISQNIKGVFMDELAQLSKKINTPIFTITGVNRYRNPHVTLDEYIPILSQIKGISSIYPPEEIYNDIAFFIGNVLNNDEDQTHLKISDKDQIVKKGFDLKTSFRNQKKRKNYEKTSLESCY